MIGIYEGKANPDILDKYSEIRRQKYQEIVDVVSQDNIRRLFDEFLKMLKQNEGNVEAQQEFMRSSNSLKYDFTQHYGQPAGKMMGDGKELSIHVEHVAEVGPA